jgi:oligopeptide/dipeptide ABC transporter ATP-binding protein
MYAGRIREHGTKEEIFGQAQDPYTWGLFESMPTVEHRLERLRPIEGSPPSLVSPPSGCPFHPRCPYAFEPCPVELPPLRKPVPEAHLDACLLPWERKQEIWSRRVSGELEART